MRKDTTQPLDGETRVRTAFLFRPKEIRDESRWFELVRWEEKCVTVCDYYWEYSYHWEPTRWIDDLAQYERPEQPPLVQIRQRKPTPTPSVLAEIARLGKEQYGTTILGLLVIKSIYMDLGLEYEKAHQEAKQRMGRIYSFGG